MILLHFLLGNGIGQNLTASVLIWVPAVIWAKIKLWPRWQAHERKVHELHQSLSLDRAEPHASCDPGE